MFADAFLDELRARVPVSEVVRRRVHLKREGREWKGLSPFNQERTPSFTVNDQKGFYHDFSFGKHGDVFSFVMETEGLPFPEAVEKLAAFAGVAMPDGRRPLPSPKSEPPIAPAPDLKPAQDDTGKRNQHQAGEIWRERTPLHESVAMVHFEQRGIPSSLIADIDGESVGFHPSCPDGPERRPAIIELLRDIRTNEPRAIRRTFLTPSGVKVGKAKALGPQGGTACKLTPHEEVIAGLTVGEGLETVLSGVLFDLRPAWALGSAGELGAFPVLDGIEALTILVDHDRSGTGQRQSLECSARWTAAGREVIRITPFAVGADINDVIRGATA
jgi:CHC2 zinc finger/Toprim domain